MKPTTDQNRADPAERLRFEALFERTNDAVFLFDLGLHCFAANRRAAEITGYSAEELTTMAAGDIAAPGEREDIDEKVAALLAGEELPLYQRTFVTRDGREFTVEIDVTLVRDDDDLPLYLQSIVRDISRRRRADRTLRHLVEGIGASQGRELLKKLVRSAAEASGVTAVAVSEILQPERTHARVHEMWYADTFVSEFIYGLEGTPCGSIVSEGRAVFTPDGIRERYPRDERLERMEAEAFYGLPLTGRDGELIGFISFFSTEPLSEEIRESRVLQLFGTRAALELERLRSARELQQSEQRYRSLVEQIPAAVYLAPLHSGCVDYISPQIQVLTGDTDEEWVESPDLWQSRIHPDDRDRVLEELRRTHTDHVPFSVEYRMYRKDGTLAWIREEGLVVRDRKGAPPVLQGLMMDVSTHKHLEEELLRTRKLDSLGLLAGGIAHDFNNLLMSSLGNLSLAKFEISPDEPAFDLLGSAEKVLLRAKGLTQQLMALAKGGAPIRRPGSIRDLIRETATFSSSGSATRLQFLMADDLWAADVDQGQIAQVVENLVINASQAMQGEGRLSIAARNETVGPGSPQPLEPGDYVCCEFTDEGPGIDGQDLPRVFDPYFTTKEQGFGLGLATSHAIVRRHEGHIHVESELGRGTTVRFFLPAAPRIGLAPEPRNAADIRGRVLVMDDDDTVREVVVSMLERLDFIADAVDDGRQALERYQAAREAGLPFDVVIVDLTVAGGMGGQEATARLLESDPEARVIVSSGYSDDPVMASYEQYGFRDCMVKPYRLQDLRETLERVLS